MKGGIFLPTVQQLLTDIDIRFPNAISDEQKIYWMNRVQAEIFQDAKHEAPPYYFSLAESASFYELPSDCETEDIIKALMETSLASGEFRLIPYREFASTDSVASSEVFYTTFNNAIYLNPVPTATTAGVKVYLYYYKSPAEINTSSLSSSPDLDKNYQDLLVYGVLAKVAQANLDVSMANNYISEYNTLLRRLQLEKLHKMPKYPSTKDVMPKSGAVSRRRDRIEVIVSG